MSVSYGIYVELDCEFVEKNIFFILNRASDLGFVYLVGTEDKQYVDTDVCCLGVDQAILKLQMVTEEILDDGGPWLHAKFQDTSFFLWIRKTKNNRIIVSCGAFEFRWDKQFDRGSSLYTIDFARYVRLLSNVCGDMNILRIETDSDLVEGIEYVNQGCVTALIDMGSFEEEFSRSLEGVKGSCSGLIHNGMQSKFIFFDETTDQPTEPSVQKCYEILKAGFHTYLYAKKDGASFKIEIKQNNQGWDFVSVYPLEPYRMKKGYESEEEKIDVAFYVQRLVELCENFAIYELKTFI